MSGVGSVAVPLFKRSSSDLSLFWGDFPNPSGLIAGNSDHLCAGWQGLLIEEWKQLGGIPPPSQSWCDNALFVKA